MVSRWRYRGASIIGTVILTIFSVMTANRPSVQEAFAAVPYFGRPAPYVLSESLGLAILTTCAVVIFSMWPLFKPRSRRILDTVLLTQKRLLLGMIALAALGYFNYSYRLPRSTLMLSTLFLLGSMPLFTVAIRRRPKSSSRTVIVGDDPEQIQQSQAVSENPVMGYVSPTSVSLGTAGHTGGPSGNGSSADLQSLGGFARLEEALLKNDVDTVLLAFDGIDREEFFGTLELCYKHGITAMVHRDYADHVLAAETSNGELLRVDLEPWDWQDYAVKRSFDIVFAGTSLILLAPVLLLCAIAIKLDSSGPVLYSQERTASFGETFTIYKLRSMVSNAESETGATVSAEDTGNVDPRVTRVGRVLRQTHLDEVPQLWSILVGDMTVVGPRPERPELDADMERGVGQWRRRWFVKPGLTGLAQIRGATGYDPESKLRYDIEYIRNQSFWFDLKIVIRQLWQVGGDMLAFLRRGTGEESVDTETDRSQSEQGQQMSTGVDETVTENSRPSSLEHQE